MVEYEEHISKNEIIRLRVENKQLKEELATARDYAHTMSTINKLNFEKFCQCLEKIEKRISRLEKHSPHPGSECE